MWCCWSAAARTRSSSISSSSQRRDEAAWRRFLRTAAGGAAGILGLAYALLLAIDPYDNVWFSPDLPRPPVTSNQRYSFPALARDPAFDSAVLGTSTARLLRPEVLGEAFGGRFVNLAMNSATAHEQRRILEVFARSHRSPRTVVFGLDTVWCEPESAPAFTDRPFPPWMYDEDRWNDLLYLLNLPALEAAGRMIGVWTGLYPAAAGRDGYANFLPPQEEYDLERARGHIYGRLGPRMHEAVVPPAVPTEADLARWRFPALAELRQALALLPAETRKVLFFVPYHHISQPAPGSPEAARWDLCKRRVAEIAAAAPNAVAFDFMIRSPVTLDDRNYWDSLHYSVAVADRLVESLAAAALEGRVEPGLLRRLPGG